MHKVHLDTDLGGDIDDLCALALLLRWPGGVHLTGITTVAEANGRRAGYVRYVLGLAGRGDIPVAAGADVAQGYYRDPQPGFHADEARYWPEPVAPAPNAPEHAIRLLRDSIEQGATVIAIGPFTNLALLERQHPGMLAQARIFLMGGYVYPTHPGFPAWGNDMDWNVQVDVKSAHHVMQHASPTLMPLTVTVETALRRADLDALRGAGALGQVLARQAEAFADDEQMAARFGATCAGVPPDIVNFQHDPLACAVALGWNEGVDVQTLPLRVEEKDGWLTERVDPAGTPVRIVTKVDGPRFNEFWLRTVARI